MIASKAGYGLGQLCWQFILSFGVLAILYCTNQRFDEFIPQPPCLYHFMTFAPHIKSANVIKWYEQGSAPEMPNQISLSHGERSSRGVHEENLRSFTPHDTSLHLRCTTSTPFGMHLLCPFGARNRQSFGCASYQPLSVMGCKDVFTDSM